MFRFLFKKFEDYNLPTLGAGFKTTDVQYINEKGQMGTQKLNLWDTAGQERFDSLTKMYFKGAEAAIIVYDVTNDLSFERAQKWVTEINEEEHHS